MTEINLTKHENPITPEIGIYRDVPYEEYDRWNAMRKSLVEPALRSGMHLEHAIKNDKKTDSLRFGSLLDCLLLEPHFYAERYAMQPSTYDSEVTRGRGDNKTTEIITKPWNLNSHTCQLIANELRKSGKEIISTQQYEKAVLCRDSLLENDIIRRSVEQSEKQVSIVWNETNTGVLCKARFDLFGEQYIDDVKTSVDASTDEFSRLAGRFLYHVQAAIYQDACEAVTGIKKDFRFFVIETGSEMTTPATAVYQLDDDSDSLLAGRLMFKRACEKIIEYERHGFCGYSQFAEPFSIPRWMIEKELNQHEEIEL